MVQLPVASSPDFIWGISSLRLQNRTRHF
uniref:Uncharacterized protein n=1 Tax=Anguilla anguilla TaxID=7936 RepID=A0A0E9SVB0_ANGAN